MPVEVFGAATVRERDGLAMSSRNERLDPTDRQNAAVLYQALQQGEQMIEMGIAAPESIKNEMAQMISQMPNSNIEYISIANRVTLEEIEESEKLKGSLLLSLAVYFGEVRLIDNIIIDLA